MTFYRLRQYRGMEEMKKKIKLVLFPFGHPFYPFLPLFIFYFILLCKIFVCIAQ